MNSQQITSQNHKFDRCNDKHLLVIYSYQEPKSVSSWVTDSTHTQNIKK
jgi:hypothetical protein